MGSVIAQCIHTCGAHGTELANCILMMLGIK
ncbi:hypothetical protein J2T20_001403 [Paenibacillus wynnii]|nr:hypothetical protein [Paenibacillus wynnii]